MKSTSKRKNEDIRVSQIKPSGNLKFEFTTQHNSEIVIKIYSASGDLLYMLRDYEIKRKGNSIIIERSEVLQDKLDRLLYTITIKGIDYKGVIELNVN